MQMHRRDSNHHLDHRRRLMESNFVSNDTSSFMMQPSSSSSSGGCAGGDAGLGYIQHTVTRFDTLAGVAIKYGVEVADIKRLNGLTTDLQMFALKTIQIPLPGRHPPSPIMSNGHDIQGHTKGAVKRRNSDLFDSIKSLKLSSTSPQSVSPSMDALQGYYGLKPNPGETETLEYALKPKPKAPVGLHRKCKSLAYGLSEKEEGVGSDKWFDQLIRRRKSEVDLQNHTPEMMLKQANSNTSGAFSAAAGKGLALRPKAASRTSDAEGPESSIGVNKSSSTPSFLDTDSNNFTIWPTSMLNLTADLQALSTAAITRPIFDGLPRPISGRKNKAAID